MITEIINLSEHKEKELMKRIDSLIRFGAFERVMGCCEEFIESNPKTPLAYVLKHAIHMNLGKYKESLQDAIDMLNSGYERDGLFLKLQSLNLLLEKPRLRLIGGSSGLKDENYSKELEKTAERALIHFKGDTQIIYMAAEGYQLIGMSDEAIELLKAHLKIKPWDVHCLYQLGLIYQKHKEYEKALACYDKGLECIELYCPLFREHFSRLILESIEQLLRAM